MTHQDTAFKEFARRNSFHQFMAFAYFYFVQKRIMVFSGLIGFILTGSTVAGPGNEPAPPWKNVRILSKDLEEEKMESVMHTFNAQLGVTCIYCHTTDTVNGVHYANFTSDAMPAKRKALEMMKMTFRLNKKFFNTKLKANMSQKPVVWCGTCHHGLPIPVNRPPRAVH